MGGGGVRTNTEKQRNVSLTQFDGATHDLFITNRMDHRFRSCTRIYMSILNMLFMDIILMDSLAGNMNINKECVI